MKEFAVDECTKNGDSWSVSGAVNVGVIEVGTVFCVLDTVAAALEGFVEREKNVRIVVQKIVSYQMETPILWEGMTGILFITGEGIDAVGPRTYLRTA